MAQGYFYLFGIKINGPPKAENELKNMSASSAGLMVACGLWNYVKQSIGQEAGYCQIKRAVTDRSGWLSTA